MHFLKYTPLFSACIGLFSSLQCNLALSAENYICLLYLDASNTLCKYYGGMFVHVKWKGCEDVKMVCTVKQLFSLWADPLVMEYFKTTKFRVLSDCSYCAEPTSHKPVLHKGLLWQGYQKCVPHSWARTHNILEQFMVAQNLRPPDADKNTNLHGTCTLQTAGHTISLETSQEVKSRHFP